MKITQFLRSLAKHALLFISYGVAGAVIALFAGVLYIGVHRVPKLKPWHEARLGEEFTAGDSARIATLDQYRALEDRLFGELRHEVYDRTAEADRRRLNRYSPGSLSDPMSYAENGNRTYELPVEKPKCGALLIHGLTDAPYMLRAIASNLHEHGCWVVGLRLPGHGTAPSALKNVHWQDWAAAVRMAARHVSGKAGPDAPVYLVGFSTGAALSVQYALAGLEGEHVPRVSALVLLSPAIGVDPMAFLAVWQSRLSRLPGLSKLAWLDVVPEYDPYKYNSFPVNAGQQIYELTQDIEARMDRLAAKGPVHGFPRTIVFQSVADATVSPEAIIKIFMSRLAPEGHEVVAFDINRLADAGPLLRPDTRDPAERLLRGPAWPFDATLVTNRDTLSVDIVALRRAAGDTAVRSEPTSLAWPRGIFSLSHSSIPVAPEDPLYGATPPAKHGPLYLGRPEVFGEKGVLAVPASALVRLRYNPFFPYVTTRMDRFLFQ
jgi:alpha-beta hydrolase superfamily lysophospholipase